MLKAYSAEKSKSPTVDDYLNTVSFENDLTYVPSTFALDFINFIKLVNGNEGESHPSPVIHYKMLDQLVGKKERLANLCFRGASKTTIFAEYLILYIAVYGSIPGFGDITGLIYVADSIENGVKSLRKNIEFRYENSEFLKEYLSAKFTDVRMDFVNIDGHMLGVKSFGAKSGLRGTKIYGKRPVFAILDDLVSDDDARSPTVMAAIRDTVYKGVDYALDPTRRKIVFCGTPFNQKDVLYEAVESGAWHVNVYPVCEKFPCTREEFRGAWPERFNYDYVLSQYEVARDTGELHSFNQELMLRIMSEEERLVFDSDIVWYDRNHVLRNRGLFNFYITTDFATSDKQSADYSVIYVWAINNNGDWMLVDGICKKMLMDEAIGHLFRLAQEYSPQSVGIEVTGQQGAFTRWIMGEMMTRNIYFTLASEHNSNNPGIRPVKDKMSRFQQLAVPLFKSKKIWLPMDVDELWVTELVEELRLATFNGFKSKNDDCLDNVSMLQSLNAWRPSEVSVEVDEEGRTVDEIWDEDESDDDGDSSYFV